jgi:hypothetical protein
MVTVVNAGALAGYSGTDHLIDDSGIADIIGRQYRSVGDALRAADSRCWMAAHNGRPARRHRYTWVECRMANGETISAKSV